MQVTPEMIERGARAMWKRDEEKFAPFGLAFGTWEMAPDSLRATYKERARVCLGAVLGGDDDADNTRDD